MRIGLYGLPTAGKSYILERIDFMESVAGSALLRQLNPDFEQLDEVGRREARKRFAAKLSEKHDFIMDGHYAFGDEIAFTSEDGELYDAFAYLYIDPKILFERMRVSTRNHKYLTYDIGKWQLMEIESLREYCHRNDKDFYVIDNPPVNAYVNAEDALAFINLIHNGYSGVEFAKQCVEAILVKSKTDEITLLDGDKTVTKLDTSYEVFGYKTHLFEGNFYTGFQSWEQDREFATYSIPEIQQISVPINHSILSMCQGDMFILTSGHPKIWKLISEKLGVDCYCGNKMSADVKYYITKLLRKAGKKVYAFGDSMNDYYMLREADEGYLVRKPDGSLSRSLEGMNMEGIMYV